MNNMIVIIKEKVLEAVKEQEGGKTFIIAATITMIALVVNSDATTATIMRIGTSTTAVKTITIKNTTIKNTTTIKGKMTVIAAPRKLASSPVTLLLMIVIVVVLTTIIITSSAVVKTIIFKNLAKVKQGRNNTVIGGVAPKASS